MPDIWGGEEDGHHAVLMCPHARTLRSAMRKFWKLPSEDKLSFAGYEWLLRLIDNNEAEIMGHLILILWRSWFVRNELTHSTRIPATNSSICFLLNYWETMCNIREEEASDRKGKQVRNQHSKVKSTKEKMNLRWIPPEDGQIKINVDGAFTNNGDASVGVVIRNSEGTVLLSAWRVIS